MADQKPLLLFPEVTKQPRKKDRPLFGCSFHGIWFGGDEIAILVTCKKDATDRLDDRIPYGLNVTLEVSDEGEIKIYEEIKARVKAKVRVKS